MPTLTVVIPTYNRADVLRKALEAYLLGSSSEYISELIVVDDGSTDQSESVVKDIEQRAPFPVRYLKQSNRGPAAARNLGIREARSAIILFTDSDIIPSPTLVEQHVRWHERNPQLESAVLGYVTWDPSIHPTAFMRWYGEHEIFRFDQLRTKLTADFHHFYTCNLSLKAAFLRTAGMFDEDFRTAAFEDTELGYRLNKQGLRLLFNLSAVAYHHQFFSFTEACGKRLKNSAAADLFFGKEAGREVFSKINSRRARKWYRVATRIAGQVRKIFVGVPKLLDSSVPLPGFVYRLCFWTWTRKPKTGPQ